MLKKCWASLSYERRFLSDEAKPLNAFAMGTMTVMLTSLQLFFLKKCTALVNLFVNLSSLSARFIL